MIVEVASCAGACYGVQRAIDLAERAAAEHGRAQTLGSLIHNPMVVADREAQGVSAAQDVSAIEPGGVAIVRSHGVEPHTLRQLNERAGLVIDATCPHVLRAQRKAREFAEKGYTVLIVGEPDHPEVKGLRAWAELENGEVYALERPEDIPADVREPVGVLAQTTQTREAFERVLAALLERGINFESCNTICDATYERQSAARELAARVDAMVVVGGYNSSNTRRLFQICSESCPLCFHVQSAGELDRAAFANCERVGVTAGASTPASHVRSVVDCLGTWC